MRWLLLAGSVLFAYLALFPGGLLISTIDSACAGPDCDQPLAEDILLGVLYTACFAAVVACSVTMVLYFFRTSVGGERLIRLSLMGALIAVSATLFAQFALAFPLAALFTLSVGGVVYGTLRFLYSPEAKPPEPDPDLDLKDDSQNGHGKLNGHPG